MLDLRRWQVNCAKSTMSCNVDDALIFVQFVVELQIALYSQDLECELETAYILYTTLLIVAIFLL